MRRIDTPDGLFAPGSPATSTKGTAVRNWWLNIMQEELAGVVEGLGGTLDPADNGQVLGWILASFAAITGNASQLFRASTPSQFDASSYVATMAALQRALGNRQGVVEIIASIGLTAGDVGKSVFFVGTGAVATMPALSSVPLGAEVEFFGISSGNNTVLASGTDVFYVNNITVTSLTIGQGGSLRLVKRTGGWAAVSGSSQLYAASKEFGSSLAANGYQKLPSGLIEQWGYTACTTTATLVTFPIAFPNALFALTFGNYGNASGVNPVSSDATAANKTSFNIYSNSAGDYTWWRAVGN